MIKNIQNKVEYYCYNDFSISDLKHNDDKENIMMKREFFIY